MCCTRSAARWGRGFGFSPWLAAMMRSDARSSIRARRCWRVLAHRVGRPINCGWPPSTGCRHHGGDRPTVRLADGRANWAMAVAEPIDWPRRICRWIPMPGGLADGHSAGARFTSADPEIADYLRAAGLDVQQKSEMSYSLLGAERGAVQKVLRRLAVLNNKHIPVSYLRASQRQRRELLAGLLDTDGTVTNGGQVQYTSTSARLAADVRELVASLGYRVSVSVKQVAGRTPESSTAYNLNFSSSIDVFRLARKVARHRASRHHDRTHSGQRYVVAVEPLSSVPVRCVQVDNVDQMYLATRSMVPTHNSTLALDLARVGLDQARSDVLHLLAGDEPDRDHHAVVVGRGEHPAQPHPQRPDERRRLAAGGVRRWARSPRPRSTSTTRPT